MDESYFDRWVRHYTKNFESDNGEYEITITECSEHPETRVRIRKIKKYEYGSSYIEELNLSESDLRDLYLILDDIIAYLENKRLSERFR